MRAEAAMPLTAKRLAMLARPDSLIAALRLAARMVAQHEQTAR
jgi:hypothetical protein